MGEKGNDKAVERDPGGTDGYDPLAPWDPDKPMQDPDPASPGTQDPDAEKPGGSSPPDHRATGTITDETGTYGPAKHSKPQEEPSGDMEGETTDAEGQKHKTWRRHGMRPGPMSGQVTDETGKYGPEKRGR